MTDLFPSVNPTKVITYNINTIVSKPIEKLRYSTRIDKNSVATNYFESEEINSTKNLVIEDNTFNDDFNDRRKFDQQFFKKIKALTYTSVYKKILFTIFTGRNRHAEQIPLFYKQKKDPTKRILRASFQKNTNASSDDLVNYGYAVVDGNLYFNYQNKYNSITGEYEIYHLNLSYEDGTSESCLINPVPAIEKRTDTNSDQITYSQLKVSNGYDYEILTPNNTTIAQLICSLNTDMFLYIKEEESNSIYLKKPEGQNIENEWIPEIVAGEVYKLTENKLFRYHIPEYKNQSFSIEAPNIKVFDKDCFIVTDKIIQLPFRKISYGGDDYTLTVKRYDLNNKYLEDLAINSVDALNGFVELESQLPFRTGEDYYIRADFFYKTETYYYNKLNLNPYFNKDAIAEKYYFYVKPNTDDESIVVFKEKENAPEENWLFLGAIFYEENYSKENSMSFYLGEKQRLFSLEESVDKNPYILQSYLGYGTQGQAIQKNNVVVIDLPAEYEKSEFYSEQELMALFKRKLRMSTNVIFNYVQDESTLKFKTFGPTSVEIELSWEGPGNYKVERSTDSNYTNPTIIYQSDQNERPGNDLLLITDQSTGNNTRYYYRVYYNGMVGKHRYSMKTRS